MGFAVTGAKMNWDGTVYVNSTCGTSTSCVEPAFAKPGKYTAKFCAAPGNVIDIDGGVPRCAQNGSAKCSSVQFDFPSSMVVKGTLGP